MKKSVQFLCLLLWGKVAESRMRGYSNISQVPHIFSSDHTLTQHLRWSPLTHWARVFSELISFVNLIFLHLLLDLASQLKFAPGATPETHHHGN